MNEQQPSSPTKGQRKRSRGEALWGRPTETRRQRLHAWMDMLFADHGLLRIVYLNRRRVSPKLLRGGQPAPWQISRLARMGVRTVINLRGGTKYGSLPLEQAACARHGLAFETFVARSRALPSREEIAAAEALFDRIAYPAYIHCKSGADRAGIMSALYLMLHENRSAAEAAKQLSLQYLHLKSGPTGILDLFMERAVEAERRGVPFRQWVATEYDPEALTAEFKSGKAGRVLVDRVLRRE